VGSHQAPPAYTCALQTWPPSCLAVQELEQAYKLFDWSAYNERFDVSCGSW